MKEIVKALIVSVFLIGWIYGCQNSKKSVVEEINSQPPLEEEINNKVPAQDAEAENPGKQAYTKYCLACHQADGSGVPGMHPPLGPGSWVGKDPKELIAIMMKGLSGKIEVGEETFNGFMPSQAQLTDEEMADVLSYVRSNFGNNFEPVDAKMVKKVRSGR